MSRQDYILIADGLVDMIQIGAVKKNGIDNAIRVMSNRLSRDNDKFNGTTFKNYVKGKL